MEFWLNIQTLIWLFPIIFIVHDFEEIIMVEKWLHNNQNKLYKQLPPKLADRIVKQFSMTTAQFAVAVIIVFLFVSGATVAANLYLYNGLTMLFHQYFLSMHLLTLGKQSFFALLPLVVLHR
ncbi:HXXEE domain-containing protein [Lysinibacillus sp. NPDC093210]|uniref:HXXEE domain-containing protein n=1 Tax=Lysinibacillus sp. NPDC093210 TaxID=3364133 RepID=UPI0037F7F9EE